MEGVSNETELRLRELLHTVELAVDLGDLAWAAESAERLALIANANAPRVPTRAPNRQS